MIDFDLLERTTPTASVVTEAPVVTATATARPLPSATGTTDLAVDEGAWGWEQLRDYVVRKIEDAHGPFPRDFKKEHAIFKSFAARWGEKAASIAKYAFEVNGGYWRNAPIGVNRFTKGCDPYFAQIIAERL